MEEKNEYSFSPDSSGWYLIQKYQGDEEASYGASRVLGWIADKSIMRSSEKEESCYTQCLPVIVAESYWAESYEGSDDDAFLVFLTHLSREYYTMTEEQYKNLKILAQMPQLLYESLGINHAIKA